MTREQATEIEEILRELYYDRSGEVLLPELFINDEDVTSLYDNLFSFEYLDGMPDFKISVPIIPKLNKEQAIDLIMEIYRIYKTEHRNPFAGKKWE